MLGTWGLSGTSAGAQSSRAERFTRLLSVQFSEFEQSAREVVRDSATFQQRWRRMRGPGKPPQIDFQRSVVILVAVGTRATTGFEAHVREVRTSGNELHVFVDLIEPGLLCPVGDAETRPATMVQGLLRVPTSSPPKIVFHDRKLVTPPCSTN